MGEVLLHAARALLAVAMLIGLADCAPPRKAEQFTAAGVVSDAHQRGNDLWFGLGRVDQTFVIHGSSDASAAFEALQDSYRTGRSIVVRYDADSGHFELGQDEPSYAVRDLVYKGKTITSEPVSVMPDLASLLYPPPAAEVQLARGVGLYGMGEDRKAHEQLALALEDITLPEARRVLALKTDGRALDVSAFIDFAAGLSRDRQLLAAYSDFQNWKELAPDDADAEFSIAETEIDLGDYDAALKTLGTIVERWPERSFWAHIRIGAIHRTRGELKEALESLDELVTKDGPPSGMAYHYHRGWTLSNLGRFAEADAEFTKGIADQPDYAWAFVRRACARAALGEFREAVPDQEEALRLFQSDRDVGPMTAAFRSDLARAGSVLQQLRAAAGKAGSPRLFGLCDGYYDYGEARRERSALVPQSMAP